MLEKMTNESAQNLKKLSIPVRNESGRELDRIVFSAAVGDDEIVIEGKFEVKIIAAEIDKNG